MKINFKGKKLLAIIVTIGIIALMIYVYFRIAIVHRSNHIFAKESEKKAEELNNPIFKIEKVMIYSDANVEDLSENKNLADINISQFTDFAVYIDNQSTIKELTAENTVNKIYVDNISISSLPMGTQKIFYKNINNLCKYQKIENGVNQIDYHVVHTNNEKEIQTEDNIFYTDCSEPLIISYVNENIVQNKDISMLKDKLSLDGSMLSYLNIGIESLNYEISFTVNIENNLGDKYATNFSLNVDLNSSEGGIYTGYIMQIFDLSTYDYRFTKL